jgi:membrane protein YdbS with pleckstrin-like domain
LASGKELFTERDWLLLFGSPREKVFTLRLWLRFAVLLLAVLAIGFALGLYLLPYSLDWFVGALILVAAGVLFIAPKWLR